MVSKVRNVDLLGVFSGVVATTLIISVAKRKACLQPEKTHGYQYLFTVQFFDSYVVNFHFWPIGGQ